MRPLRSSLIRLAHSNPKLRPHLLPLLKEGASGDPYWMTAKYPGTDANGKPFRKGEKVFYYPRTKTVLTGTEAEKASREFESARFDEGY